MHLLVTLINPCIAQRKDSRRTSGVSDMVPLSRCHHETAANVDLPKAGEGEYLQRNLKRGSHLVISFCWINAKEDYTAKSLLL